MVNRCRLSAGVNNTSSTKGNKASHEARNTDRNPAPERLTSTPAMKYRALLKSSRWTADDSHQNTAPMMHSCDTRPILGKNFRMVPCNRSFTT